MIPESWARTILGDVISISSGQGLTKSKMIEGEIPVFGGNGVTGWHNDSNIEKETIAIGRVGYYCGSVHLTPKRAWITDNAFITSFDEKVMGQKFLYLLLTNADLRQNDSSTAQPVISGAKVYPIEINLPPLAEQKVIADKLDELLAQVESTKARLDAIPAILKSFRQSVLAAAVSGKLTEEWREKCAYTPASISLDEIKVSRINRLGKKSPSKTHLLSEEYIIPESWQWVSLDFLSLKIVDGTHHTPTYIDAGIPFISVKDIKNGQINFESTKFISEAEHDTLSKRCKPEIGDLLITKSGTIGRTAIVKQCIEFSLFVSVALIKPVSSMVNMQFIDIALQKWVNEIDVSSRIVGTAIKNLHLQDMKVLAIPFAPIEEQTEIVRRVEELFALADKVEVQVNAAQARVNNLTQSILAKAFRGELTADWRAANPELISGDNSAEALLKRIKAERAKLKPVKKTTAKKAKA